MSKVIYENPLNSQECIGDFILEGKAEISFPEGAMRLKNALSPEEGQKANFVLWCPVSFPSDVRIDWEFRPLEEPGLAMMFFAAKGRSGVSIFDETLSKRTGEYKQYHSGDINAFHVSYFRRKEPDERAFHTCNLRKSYGFYLVSQGADPIPDAADASDFYTLTLLKYGEWVRFAVNGLEVFSYRDDGETFGPRLEGGKIGFRQLAPMIGEYRDLCVYELNRR